MPDPGSAVQGSPPQVDAPALDEQTSAIGGQRSTPTVAKAIASLTSRAFRKIVHGCTLRGFSLRARIAAACVAIALVAVGAGALVGGGVGVAISSAIRNAFASEPLIDEKPLPAR